MRSKDQKIFNLISHTVMILVTVMAVLPFVLVFLSSVTEENTLVLNGYSFFPEKFSLYAYEYIVMKGKRYSGRMRLPCLSLWLVQVSM